MVVASLNQPSSASWWISCLTCCSIIVCSNLGPDIANSLGIWLLDHTLFLFGACIDLLSSAISTFSCKGVSPMPTAVIGVSFVLDTLGVECRFELSFAGFNVGPPCRATELVELKDRTAYLDGWQSDTGSRVRARLSEPDMLNMCDNTVVMLSQAYCRLRLRWGEAQIANRSTSSMRELFSAWGMTSARQARGRNYSESSDTS